MHRILLGIVRFKQRGRESGRTVKLAVILCMNEGMMAVAGMGTYFTVVIDK